MSTIILRPYQEKIINETREFFNNGKRSVLIQLRTGGGKTAIAAHIVKSCSEAGNIVWFNCHRKELIYQTSEAFDKMGIKHSFVAAGMPHDSSCKVQICSVPTLVKRYRKIAAPNWIIWDETRMIGSKTWRGLYNDNSQARHIGLDASPVRERSRGLGDFYEAIVHGPSYDELVNLGYLSKYKAYAPVEPDLSGVKISMGDYANEQLALEMSKPKLVGSAVDEYIKHSNGKSAVVFAVNVNHSKLITEAFVKAGIAAKHLDGITSNSDRISLIRDFKMGKIKVVSNVDILSCGFDFPGIHTLIMLRPTHSLSLHIQQIGRVLRPAKDKEHAIILDHSGNLKKHGLPCFEHEWSLDSKPKKKSKSGKTEAQVKVCPECFSAVNNFAAFCDNCGHQFEIKQRTGPEQVDGDLEEIDKLEFSKQKKKEQSQARTLEQLIELGKSRGYKSPKYWAECVLKSRGVKR